MDSRARLLTRSAAAAPEEVALAAVSGAMAGLALLRGRRRAAHPTGRTVRGVVHRGGLDVRIGVPWLDSPGRDEAAVRLSRGAGLPAPLPDLLGLAFRVRGEDGAPYDLLLSSARLSPLGRHLPAPQRDVMRATYSSFVAYRSPVGRLLLAAMPSRSGTGFVLAVASPSGPWQPFAELEVDTGAELPDVTFDPVLHAVPGFAPGPRMAALRRAGYSGSRRGRGAELDD